ncbi:ATP synthase F1 subunit delta [Legionella beliardensis]|uniref:ATP synthase subunit delta n=1 Tax=Legionella beliardensis TaxID=91822 RepID=A0A378I4W7_9GAMM|nr:F0F1 ATP synthase subunit delta [Legionella beliardensis]STX30229.1 ATP synthase F1 subunit delta [Legionella beliardensis]
MSESVTIARPYAKAIFKYAFDAGKLRQGSEYLHNLALVVLDKNAANFINNPASTVEQHVELLMSANKIASEDAVYLKNFITLLAENKRLMALPDIYNLFEAMRAEQEKTLIANVISYSELSKDQQQKLINTLSGRLQRKVTLQITIDKKLIGGAVILAGDLVIDGSVRGKLDKLSTSLAA